MDFTRDDPDTVVEQRLRDALAVRAPDLAPWLPLIAIAFGLEVAPTPEVEMLAENNRRPKLHEVVGRFLAALMTDPTLIQIENAQHMDRASAELLTYLCEQLSGRPWLFAVARREAGSHFTAPEMPAVARLKLEPLAASDAFRLTQLATADDPLPRHVLEVVAQRSGGNPQFLRDLLRAAIESGGTDRLARLRRSRCDGAHRRPGSRGPNAGPACRHVRTDLPPSHAVLVRR